GLLNAITFGGSFLTLPALLWLGLPPHVANGTNRVGILLAALVATLTFAKGGKVDARAAGRLLAPSLLGALIGASIAAELPDHWLERSLAALMLVFLGVLVLRPQRFLREGAPAAKRPHPAATFAIFLGIGVFGGFIQAGVGILLLFGLVLHLGHDLVRANGLKNLLVLAFTGPALAVFHGRGQVDWAVGLWLAGGQCVGAWVASRFAVTHPRADVWIRRLLVLVLLATALDLLGLFDGPRDAG
ncbi:MAG: sulfite exporter TauE/SafE family protein, partial [Planctomycetota bacterium JB042]